MALGQSCLPARLLSAEKFLAKNAYAFHFKRVSIRIKNRLLYDDDDSRNNNRIANLHQKYRTAILNVGSHSFLLTVKYVKTFFWINNIIRFLALESHQTAHYYRYLFNTKRI